MELNSLKKLLLAKNWIDNTTYITYRFINDTEVIISDMGGHTYALEKNSNDIFLILNSNTSPQKFNLEIIDEENLQLSDSKKTFTLTVN